MTDIVTCFGSHPCPGGSGRHPARARGAVLLLALSGVTSAAVPMRTVWIPEAEYRPFQYTPLPTTYLNDGRAAFWNLANDFSAVSNPTGEWSFGWSISRFGGFNLSPNAGAPLIPGVPGWFNLANGLMPCVVRAPVPVSFPDLGTGVTLPANSVGIQPDALGKFACVLWTCPQDGQYQIEAQFTGRSTSETGNADVVIRRNNVQLFFSNVRDPRQISILQTTFDLVAGETMDFRVGKGTDSNLNDLKQLDVVIQRVLRICIGDINGDLIVNSADLAILLGQYGQSVPPSEGGDLNGDGFIDLFDLQLLITNLGCIR